MMGPRHLAHFMLWLALICSTPETNFAESLGSSTQGWFVQDLDHFNQADEEQWNQRYWVNTNYYETGAPVFLYVGGDWEETGLSEDLSEPWEQNAVNHNALMFKLEHRFYGESLPTGDNFTVENLKYISSDQVLADLANFIDFTNRQYQLPKGTKWIAFGCSYAGSLAAWLRYKYPHLVYGAVASSAALQFQVEFREYFNAVGEALTTFYGDVTHNQTLGEKCVEAFKDEIQFLDLYLGLVEFAYQGVETVKGLFKYIFNSNNSTEELNTANLDSNVLFHIILRKISSRVQENHYNESSGKWDIESVCDSLLNRSSRAAIVEIVDLFKTIESDPALLMDFRKRFYQACSEFGNFQTIDDTGILGNLIPEDYLSLCKDEFGETFTEEFVRSRVKRTNRVYGGLDIEAARVIYVHGSLDPWLSLGINSIRNPLSPVIVIEGAFHCTDMRPSADYDSAALSAARQQISDTLSEWPTTSSS